VRKLESATAAEIVVDGRTIVNFAGSPYLGISRDPALISAATDALRKYGARAYIPPEHGLVTQPHLDVESESAKFFGTASALYLASGYLLGLTVLTGHRSRFDAVLLDESAHYNLRDAAAASGAVVRTFKHLDCDSLKAQLVQMRRENLRAVIAVDGMCPTFGSIPRLEVYAELASKYGAWLFVDESHSFGTLGATGRGAVEQCGLRPEQALCGGSLGKAFSATGAVLVGSAEDIVPLRSTPCVRGSSWGMVAGAAMAAASLRLVRSRPEILVRLRTNIKRFKTGLRRMGLDVPDTVAPLATFVAGSAAQMQSLQQRLLAEDFFVLHSRYAGAGPDGAIRCSVFGDHTDEHIDAFLSVLARLL
jgi:7-keto-8-aminopelargonate synthetase-like enzyme